MNACSGLSGVLMALLMTCAAHAQSPKLSSDALPPDEVLRPILSDAVKAVQKIEKPSRTGLLDFQRFVLRMTEEEKVEALATLAKAQAKVGDREGAKVTIEATIEIAEGIRGRRARRVRSMRLPGRRSRLGTRPGRSIR